MTDLLSLWAMAAAAKLGIRISTDDPGLLRQQLYKARAESGGYKDLGIVLPAIEGQLWIIHSDADERGTFDQIHPQPVLEGPGFPSKKVRGAGGEQGNSRDIEELGEGETE